MERDSTGVDFNGIYGNFNSHAHVERDNKLWELVDTGTHFNSHAHVERDFTNFSSLTPTVHFNSHAHVERDQKLTGDLNYKLLFQLTRSRGA